MDRYSIIVDRVYNNSLGEVWLLKLYDEDTGELLEKCSYDSEYSGVEALDAFNSSYVEAYTHDFEDIEMITVMPEAADPELVARAAFIEDYGLYPSYAVEYRDMMTALHHLLVFDDEEDAENAFASLSAAEESGDESEADWAFGKSTDDIEINFRDVDFDERVNAWYWENPYNGSRIIVANTGHIVPDVF